MVELETEAFVMLIMQSVLNSTATFKVNVTIYEGLNLKFVSKMFVTTTWCQNVIKSLAAKAVHINHHHTRQNLKT